MNWIFESVLYHFSCIHCHSSSLCGSSGTQDQKTTTKAVSRFQEGQCFHISLHYSRHLLTDSAVVPEWPKPTLTIPCSKPCCTLLVVSFCLGFLFAPKIAPLVRDDIAQTVKKIIK